MNKKISIILLIIFLVGCKSNPQNPQLNRKHINTLESIKFIHDKSIVIEKTISPFTFDNINLNSLKIDRIILTPGINPTQNIGITFNLEIPSENVSVIILDENNFFIDEFITTYKKIVIKNNTINTYKTVITNLKANSTYKYIIRNNNLYSSIEKFKTIGNYSTKLLFLGDIQGYKLSQYEAITEIYDYVSDIDLTYLAGDIVDNGDNFDQWSYFNTAMSPFTSSSLWISTIGNHDVKGSDVIYINSFNYPKNGIPNLEERNFYIDLPFARIAVFDSESYSKFEEQSQWLIKVMNESSKFKIVLIHRSAYPISYNENHIRKLSSIFEEANVNLVLSGHDHIYSRTTMMNNKLVEVNKGVTYIVGGSPSGSKYYNEKQDLNRYWKTIVYDDNNPVYIVLYIEEKDITIKSYAIISDKNILIDELIISK